MKPSFALNFTDDSVALLHRTKRGWLEVGRTAYDTPDLGEALAYMRSTALGLSPQGITTKLVIPASQVRYLRIDAPGPTDGARRAQIAAALDGRTAYDVRDLAFDWSGTGTTVDVAIVARETLAEAEAFAVQHRFGPLSFVALPQDGTFAGEPWFGLTEHASRGLVGGETVERDAEAITILSRSLARDTTASLAGDLAAAVVFAADPEPSRPEPSEPAPPVIDPPEPAPAPQREPEPEPEVEPDPDPVPGPAPRPKPEPVTEPHPAPEPTPVPEPVPASVPEPAPEVPEPEPVQIPQPDVTPDPGQDLPPPAEMPGFDPVDDPVVMAAPAAKPVAPPAKSLAVDADEAPIALDVEDDDIAPPIAPQPVAVRPVATNVTDNTLVVDDDSPADTATFASRRVPALAGATVAAAQSMARRLGAASRSAQALRQTPTAPRSPKFGFTDPVEPPVRQSSPAAAPTAPPVAKPAPIPAQTVTAPVQTALTIAPAPQIPGQAGLPRTPAPRPAAAVAKPRPGPRSLTAPARGKPRHLALILTGLLLVALALAAAMSSYYAASIDSGEPETLASANPDTIPAVPAVESSVDDEMLADGQDPATAADPSGADLTTADLGVPAQAPAMETSATPVTSVESPALRTSANGGDEIYLSSTDIAPSAVDAAALPVPEARGDPAPSAPLPPPAFGTVYTFDANGLIVPTPEGITTPEGVLLVAGKPPMVPPARPANLAPPVVPPLPDATATEDQTQAFPADPALRGKRPAARPADFAAAAPPADPLGDPNAVGDAPSLAPQADSRLASLRPLARPAAVADTASTLALVTPDGAIAPLGGLALSPRPAARPSAIASAVEAAVAAAAIQPDPEPAPAIVDDGTVTPETEEEPRLASAAPAIPSSANVAKEATDKNVINLGKVNLIGVYGTQSNRYALVRQPNGRIVKVGVGDRIDGGRVAAVTATELRYEKRGQMLVLAMPRG